MNMIPLRRYALHLFFWGWQLFFLAGLTACSESIQPTATLPASPTVLPAIATATIPATPEKLVRTEIAAASLTLSLPDTWVVGESQLTPLGLVIHLGPEPLGPGPFSSTLIVTDPNQYEAATLAAALACNQECAVPLIPTTVAGQPAQKAILGADSPTPLEWFFLTREGQLLAFTLHDAQTLITRSDLVDSLELDEVVLVATATSTPTATPLPPPTATPTLVPPTATPGPPVEEPLAVVIAFLHAAANDPDTLGVTYLSNNLRTAIGEGETLLDLMALDQGFINFSVRFSGNLNNVLSYEANLHLSDGSTTWRMVYVIAEEGQWVMNGFLPITPPPNTATPDEPDSNPTPTSEGS